MRTLVLFTSFALALHAESYPRAWNFVAPDATAVVGIEWTHLHDTFLGEAVGSELSTSGRLGIPDLECLQQSRQIVLSAPDFLAIFTGTFPAATVEEQAVKAGLWKTSYQGIRLWIAPEKTRRSLAQVSDSILMVGWRDTLEEAIDRGMQTDLRTYSPLLARGARLAARGDFWMVSSGLPDPLVSVFLPIGIETGDFDGAVTLRKGLALDARYNMATTEDALLSARYFREAIPSFHRVFESLHVIPEGESVLLKLDLTAGELASYLHPPEPPPAPKDTAPAPAAPAGPQVVRIVGLDDGPREVRLPSERQ